MSPHILDRPIWSALTTWQEPLAEINGPARRYPADIAPFADLADFSEAGFAALHELLGSGESAVLFTPDPVMPTAGLEIVMAATGEQLTGAPTAFTGRYRRSSGLAMPTRRRCARWSS